jgi:hypothetical protein
MSTSTVSRHRPIGVVILSILAGVSALGALWRTLQYLHILPFTLGPLQFYGFDLIAAILWGVTAAIWIWAALSLWNLNPQALTFVVILAAWNLILAVLEIFGASTFGAVLPAIVLNGVILIYGMSPGVRRNFGVV